MTYRVRNIVIAVVLAALAALMTSYYVTNYKRHVQQGEQHVQVYVASQDIPAGTAGTDAMRMLKKKDVTRSAVAPGALSKPDEIKTKIASQRIYAGEQVTVNRFSTVSQSGIQGSLKGTLRAYEIAGTSNQVLAGILKAGDHVDVVANFRYKSASAASSLTYAATRIVLRNLKVLRAPTAPGTGSKLGGSFDTKYPIVLAVTDNQSQKLLFASHNSEQANTGGDPGWWLELRPNLSPADSPGSLETMFTMLRDGLSQRQAQLLFGKLGGS
ncbi:MAG: Flp pilus assembly protein CpaB [Actinobacteria bacterium]|nr:MAG: Flp pilus assembly protein CpaB [Actinomycetota bacterium]